MRHIAEGGGRTNWREAKKMEDNIGLSKKERFGLKGGKWRRMDGRNQNSSGGK
jgi:hypothetical protein